MKFDDIVALAKQGYKPADIRELLAISTESKEVDEPATSDEDSQPATGENAETKKPEEKKPEETKETEPDYKALYEKSQEDLKKAQSFNVNKSVEKENKKSIDDQLLEMMENLLK